MKDSEIKHAALTEFVAEAPRKFDVGMLEHNPEGKKGLWRMSEAQLVDAAKEEVIDLWHYIVTLEHKVNTHEKLIAQLKRTIAKHKHTRT